MNSAAKLLHECSLSPRWLLSMRFTWTKLIAFVLSVSIFLGAFAMVYVTNQIRYNFHQLQAYQQQATELREEWGQLMLERSAWSSQARIRAIASHRLKMVVPVEKEKMSNIA